MLGSFSTKHTAAQIMKATLAKPAPIPPPLAVTSKKPPESHDLPIGKPLPVPIIHASCDAAHPPGVAHVIDLSRQPEPIRPMFDLKSALDSQLQVQLDERFKDHMVEDALTPLNPAESSSSSQLGSGYYVSQKEAKEQKAKIEDLTMMVTRLESMLQTTPSLRQVGLNIDQPTLLNTRNTDRPVRPGVHVGYSHQQLLDIVRQIQQGGVTIRQSGTKEELRDAIVGFLLATGGATLPPLPPLGGGGYPPPPPPPGYHVSYSSSSGMPPGGGSSGRAAIAFGPSAFLGTPSGSRASSVASTGTPFYTPSSTPTRDLSAALAPLPAVPPYLSASAVAAQAAAAEAAQAAAAEDAAATYAAYAAHAAAAHPAAFAHAPPPIPPYRIYDPSKLNFYKQKELVELVLSYNAKMPRSRTLADLRKAVTDAVAAGHQPNARTLPPSTFVPGGAQPIPHIAGKGVMASITPKYHYDVDKFKLGILSLSKINPKTGAKLKIMGLKNRQVSDAFREALVDTLRHKKICDLSDLEPDEREYFLRVIATTNPELCEVKESHKVKMDKFRKENSHRVTESVKKSMMKKAQDHLMILAGERASGNDSPEIKIEFKKILKKLVKAGYVSPDQAEGFVAKYM